MSCFHLSCRLQSVKLGSSNLRMQNEIFVCYATVSRFGAGVFIVVVLFRSEAKCIAVNVEYRLSPEHKCGVIMDDTCAVARWILDNKTAVG